MRFEHLQILGWHQEPVWLGGFVVEGQRTTTLPVGGSYWLTSLFLREIGMWKLELCELLELNTLLLKGKD